MQKIEQSSAGSGQSIQELRERIRHSAAHLMADAVTRLFPEAKLGIGPPTQDGFYYDLEVSRPFTPEDLERITGIMEETIARDLPFVLHEHGRDEIKQLCHDQPYKLELIDEIPDDETLTTYTHDAFTDLCQGPHVASTGRIPAFKLLSVAGAYWRGSETRPMLQRIYGTAFENRKALRQHLNRLAEAEKRDHRRLGRGVRAFPLRPLGSRQPLLPTQGRRDLHAVGRLRARAVQAVRLPGSHNAGDILHRPCGSAPATTITTWRICTSSTWGSGSTA